MKSNHKFRRLIFSKSSQGEKEEAEFKQSFITPK